MPQFPAVSGAESLGGDNGKTGSKSDGETGDQEHEVSGGTYRRQSRGANVFSNDHGVDHVIQLLKDIPDEKGNGKADQQRRDGAPGHIQLHNGNSFNDFRAQQPLFAAPLFFGSDPHPRNSGGHNLHRGSRTVL